VQRGHDPYRGWWTLPTGFVEYGEDAAETAAREVLEETGLIVELTGYQGIYFGGGDPRGASHVAVFTARRLDGTLSPGDDAADAHWYEANEVPAEIAFEGHRKAIARWQQTHGHQASPPVLTMFAGAGPAPPMLIFAIVENPRGTRERIVYDADRHDFAPNGDLFAGPLPFHYGWMPRTVSPGDGSELDVAVLGEGEAVVGSALAVRPIGALLREDGDHKIVAIRADLPSAYATVVDVRERPDLQEPIEAAFRTRGAVRGWASASEARGLILAAQRAWIERHGADG
jgi:8-oxo-dGTP diphosphatase